MEKGYFKYWGKTEFRRDSTEDDGQLPRYHLLVYHLLDVAAVAWTLLEQDEFLRKRLARMCGIDDRLFQVWFTFMAGLHDVGKFSTTFQWADSNTISAIMRHLHPELVRKNNDWIRHDLLGEMLWIGRLEEHIANNTDMADIFRVVSGVEDTWIKPIFGHHGIPNHVGGWNDVKFLIPKHFPKEHINDPHDFVSDWSRLCSSLATQKEYHIEGKNHPGASWAISGLVVLCDWVGSSDLCTSYESTPMPLEEYWTSRAIPNAQDALRTFSLLPGKTAHKAYSCHELFGFIHTPLQRLAEEYCPSGTPELIIIEDVTGAGKTEAALLLTNRIFASGSARGAFFALPTMATANAMYERMSKEYRKLFAHDYTPSLVLAHGGATINDSFNSTIFSDEGTSGNANYSSKANDSTISAECNAWFADNRKKSLLADLGVGTIDQTLLSVLMMRYQSLRLFGLFGKVLIVDEVHANDTYVHTLLQKVILFHTAFGGSVILLSASLPTRMKKDLLQAYRDGMNCITSISETHLEPEPQAPYPLVTIGSVQGERFSLQSTQCDTREELRRRITVKMLHQEAEVLDCITQSIAAGKCVCWIRNSVEEAIQASTLLSELSPILFHARFTMYDRLSIEEKILSKFGKKSDSTTRRSGLVIATQVVEQSLDVDFDVLITDIAPIDSLIQRFGRTFRHSRDLKGNRSEREERSPLQVFVHSPDPYATIDSQWLASFSKNTSLVYQDHQKMYRTARLLADKKVLSIPEDIRPIIESVYSEDEVFVEEECFSKASIKVQGSASADRYSAEGNTINIKDGYNKGQAPWSDERDISTRLGEVTIALRLGKLLNGKILPWAEGKSHAWQLSQVNVKAFHVNEEFFADAEYEEAEIAKQTMPDKGKFSLLVVLSHEEGDIWKGFAQKKNPKTQEMTSVVIRYSPTLGLTISEEEMQ